MTNNKYDIFLHDLGLKFESVHPFFFGLKLVTFDEFKNLSINVEFEKYFVTNLETKTKDNLFTEIFLISSYVYFYYFESFYADNEIFNKNKQFIYNACEKKFYGIEENNKFINEHNLSKKWRDIVDQIILMNDNADKVLYLIQAKNQFVIEYVNFFKWFRKELKKSWVENKNDSMKSIQDRKPNENVNLISINGVKNGK